jgi:hypothetical protein
LGGRVVFILESVLLHEFFNASGGIDQFLLASKKGMAIGANFQIHIANCGTNLKSIATGAGNGSYFIFGMYFLFHVNKPPSTKLFHPVIRPS